MVVERVTGEEFPDWMRRNVFEPLGMTRTLVRASTRDVVPASAQGYAPSPGGSFQELTDLPGSMGAGGIYATLGDLALWMRNLRTAELGGAAVMQRMTTPYVLTTGDTTTYALGLMVEQDRGLRVVQHGGADSAHRSHFLYYPELDAGLIVLSNHAGFPRSLAARISEVFFGDRMEIPDGPAVGAEQAPVDGVAFDPALFDPVSFDIFAGRYELAIQPGFILSFRREGDRLLTQATGQPAIQIVPTSDSTFTLVGIPASITFHRDEHGAVTGLTLHQNGHHAARRLDDPVAAPVDLAPFVGRYYSPEFESFYTAAIEDDHLVLRHRRLRPITLNHAGGDRFGAGFPIAEVEFYRDGAGRVAGFRASNGRARDVVFERVP
jgi:hypothetical protein